MHALDRLKERYNSEFNDFDLMMIGLLIELGLAKKIQHDKNKLGEIPKNRNTYHLRYGGLLIKAIMTDDFKFITFLPVGKRISPKKYYKNKTSKDYIYMMKRIGKNIDY